ncbi:MAG: hydrogenase maturation protease [Methylomonas sp.]|nr:hydrogenase maturation protease [Methylomonas sp.]PPD19875.1 MAG: Ni/Fe hydrogenase [Methylomonas sp.]PPD25443.1 MAG: Ni/Fe hydrogenase [Methylomonas sp.]PPD36088.1 MAG: Ni/Fe hydrogenase [Methylomonas sp.]PPD39400.1 MAG: Ni/Fe hydrogenase [Methylomonas sp.]
MTRPVLVFACGNPSRGDDAVGPLLLDYLASRVDLSETELLTDFQLQIEHALDLQHRKLVLFVDASVSCRAAFSLTELRPVRDNSYTSHAMSPSALLQVYQSIHETPPPPSFLLSIRAEQFELGAPLSGNTLDNLIQASVFAERLLAQFEPCPDSVD